MRITRFPREVSLLDQISTLHSKLNDYQKARYFLNLSNDIQQTSRNLLSLAKANLEITKKENCQASLKMTIANLHQAFKTMNDKDEDDFYNFALDFYISFRLFKYSSMDIRILYALLKTDLWELSSKAIRKNYLLEDHY